MELSTVWWLLAGALVAIELVTGTFYLLMVSFGFMAAAVSAYWGVTLSTQFVVAALLSGGLVLFWRLFKKSQDAPTSAQANHDVNMDIGEVINIFAWEEDLTCQVKYRGANWQVSLFLGEKPNLGKHKIIEVVGNRLIVKKV